ncbi:MAG: ABC transporter permease [Gemmatimonadetes bacterium]|nr:ABC transporter permease [Gemmatimonadota bacterium]
MLSRGIVRLFELVARPFRGGEAVDREIATHLELQIEALIAGGMSPETARRVALDRFGDVASYRRGLIRMDDKAARARRWRAWWGDLAQDLGLVFRGLRRSPGFGIGVIATLALGIGVNVTMIGLVDRLLFKAPAHVVDPGAVVRYTLTQTHPSFGSFTNASVTFKELDLQRRSGALTGLAAYYPGSVSYGRGESARSIRASLVTADFFGLLGIRPATGRFFDPADDPIEGGSPIAVISERLWVREFAGSREVVGRSLWLGSRQYQIVGVAPRGFAGIDLNAVDVWLPLNTGAREFLGSGDEWRDTWDWQWVRLVGRLRPEATRERASAEATALYRAAVADHHERKDDRGTVTFQPLIAGRGTDQSQTPTIAALLAGVSILVLLISCANVANLMLARGLSRRREIAVRVALGVGRGRLIRATLLESVCHAGLASVVGLGIAALAGSVIRSILLPGIDFIDPPVDGRLLAVAFGVALVAGSVVGLAPAIRLWHLDPAADLKAAGPTTGDHAAARTGLLGFQAVLSVVMLLCAGLYYKSLWTAASIDFGFRPEGLLTADIDLGVAGYGREQQWAFYDQALERVRLVPGVASAALTTTNPFWTRQASSLRLPGRDSLPRLKTAGPYFSAVTPEYFATLGLRVARGRGFADRDNAGAQRVMVINETMARTYWPGEEPIGKCAFVGRAATVCREVVGVTVDASNESLEVEPVMGYYLPLAQVDGLAADRFVMIRATDRPEAIAGDVGRALQTLAPNLPVATVRLMQDQIEPLLRPWRLGATLFGLMAAIALAVALVGLYSVLAFQVAQRRRELGIRTALGAGQSELAKMVVVQGQRVVLTGIAIGLVVSLAAVKLLVPADLLRRLLFQTSPFDPVVVGAAAGSLIVTTLLGSLIPARRAGRVPPMEAIRAD